VLRFAQTRGLADSFDELVESCLADYDLGGWSDDTWL
jgi:hypothetical protein